MAADLVIEAGGKALHLSPRQIKGVMIMQQAGNVLSDPRDDLKEDSYLWERLLPWSYGLDGAEAESLFGALKGFRSCGARLEVVDGSIRLRRGELGAEEYADLRNRYLMPHAERLNKLLSDLGAWVKEKEDAKREWRQYNERQAALL